MTMSSAVSKVTLNGDGVQTSWPFAFKVWKAADLEVSITNAEGVTTVVSNWSVSLADTGGTVTYPTSGPALPSGHKITIARSMDFLQDVDLVSGTRWDPEVVETALDRATAERQQLKEKLDRAIVVDIAATTTPEALRDSIFAARDTAVDNAASALNSANAAAASATAAAASFDAFDDLYLGVKASDPTTDNDGNALQDGALYWNTADKKMRVWDGSSWQSAAGPLVGNADTATKLQTARTITIGNTGKSFDGSADVSWSLAEIGAVTPQGLAAYAGALLFRNRIINGKMEIAQRGTSFTAVASGAYTLDRWVIGYITNSVTTVSQSNDVPTGSGFSKSLAVSVTTADASIASDEYYHLVQQIEGYNIADLIGKTFTISFWVKSSKTGIHSLRLRNADSSAVYVVPYNVGAANTWEYKTITITGGLPSASLWNLENGIGLSVQFILAAGTSWRATSIGAWINGNANLAHPDQVNCLDTVGNIFAITGVQLEPGPYATQFEHLPYGLELALCQRYFWKPESNIHIQGYASAQGGSAYQTLLFPARMRTTPTVTAIFAGAVNATGSVLEISPSGFQARAVSTAGADYTILFLSSSSASAEL